MALAKRILAVLIAAALALAPVGSAMARFNGPHSMTSAGAQSSGHGEAHSADHGAMHGPHHHADLALHHHPDTSTPPDPIGMDQAAAGHCDHARDQATAPASDKDCDCCDDKQAACAEFCLQKCFGQLCVFPPDRLASFDGSDRFRLPPAERPPDWVPAPLTPPPRT